MNFKKWDWCLALELLQLLLLVIGVQGYPKQTKNVMTGSNVTLLPPRKHLGNYKRLTWLYTTKQKILEHENKTKYFNSTFKNRVKLDLESGALHIYEVWRRDSGVYYLRVYNEREEEWAINLTVWDPVPKPFITFKKKEESKDSCYLSLYCEIEDQTADYVWYNDSGPFPNENQADVLELTVNPQNYSTFYTCQVRNPVSSKNDTVYFTPPCGLARSSGVTWIATWLVALAPIMLCSLLI